MDARFDKDKQKRKVCNLYDKLKISRQESQPSIDYLDEEHDKIFKKMHEAYEMSSVAYERGDIKRGLKYSKKGRRNEATLGNIIEARRRFTIPLKEMGANLAQEKAILNRLRARVAEIRCDFHDWMKIMNFVFRNQEEIAYNAGVPAEFLRNMRVELHDDKSVHLLFGGDSGPLGKHHAHYVVYPDGFVSYDRDPNAPHGPQNFNTRVAKKTSS
ncbi:MAG: hypothetical protein WCP11_02515 [Candidatus Saccharibacteria bacterium]